jgi:hypothetical protein
MFWNMKTTLSIEDSVMEALLERWRRQQGAW